MYPMAAVSRDALLLDDNGVTFRQFLNDFMSMAKYLETGRGLFARFMGLTPSQYSMIMLVAESSSDGGISPRTISMKLQQQNTYVIAQLKLLSKKSLIASKPNPKDKRSILYELTQTGSDLIESARPLVQAANDSFFKSVSREELEVVSKTLNKISREAEDSLENIRLLALSEGFELHDGKIRIVLGDD